MEDLDDWIIHLKSSNKLVVVEGKKDRAVLKSLGIINIITLNKPLFQIVESISEITKECILLPDLDREGRKIYSYLKKNLERRGVKVDSKYREFLFSNSEVTNIEGLKNYL